MENKRPMQEAEDAALSKATTFASFYLEAKIVDDERNFLQKLFDEAYENSSPVMTHIEGEVHLQITRDKLNAHTETYKKEQFFVVELQKDVHVLCRVVLQPYRTMIRYKLADL